MSALQEILEKGFVDPEVLMQLGEEQKQILFIKMREEQLRKWRAREIEFEKQEQNEIGMGRLRNGQRKSVKWLCGKDGNVWVWIMGEHSDDQTIEQILDNESKEKARRLAENEIMQTLRKAEDLPIVLMKKREFGRWNGVKIDDSEEDETLKTELEQIDVNGKMQHGLKEQKFSTNSPYDELLNGNNDCVTDTNCSNIRQCPDTKLSINPAQSNDVNVVKSTIEELENDIYGKAPTTLHFVTQGIYDNVSNFPSKSTHQLSLQPLSSPSTLSSSIFNIRQLTDNQIKGTTGDGRQFDGQPAQHTRAPPVPEKPICLRRTVSNGLNNGRLPGIEQFAFNTIRSYIPNDEMEKRQSKIFEQLKEQRERLDKEAELEAGRQQHEYEEREQRAKEAEESIRRIAQKARERHRALLRTSDALLPLFRNNQNGVDSVRDALKFLPRPPKPNSRQAIIQWFCESEIVQWKITRMMELPSWFHGIITREEAERLLHAKSIGAFLVRITERIFGYTVSYRSTEGIKNFLVERIADGYQFMGTNQLVHATLMDLVKHHTVYPITAKGREVLCEAIGQERHPPDFYELFQHRPEMAN